MARGEIIIPVQALRFVAALAVVLSHAEILACWTGRQLGHAAERWAFSGAAGVDVFFVISGFVMVHASRGWFGVPGAGVLACWSMPAPGVWDEAIIQLDLLQCNTMSGAGPRGPNAARALCEERLHD